MALTVAIISAEHLEREAVFAALVKRGAVTKSDSIFELPVNGLDGTHVVFHSIQSLGRPNRAHGAYQATFDLLGGSQRIDLALFVGTAGCLDTPQEFPIGQVVIPREVVWAPDNREISMCGGEATLLLHPAKDLLELADGSGSWRSSDRLVTVDHLVTTAAERRALLALEGKPLVVAMEDSGFLLAAQTRAVPAATVRAIMDHIQDRSNESQKDRNKKKAAKAAAEAAIELALKYRLIHGFNERYASQISAARDAKKAEANAESLIEGLIRHVTGDAELQLSIDRHNRVDISNPDLVIEVETDLRKPNKVAEGFAQIDRYLEAAHTDGLRIASGFVTDGVEWHYFQRTSSGVQRVGEPFSLKPDEDDTRRLIDWIHERTGAASERKAPSPNLIERHLGAKSPTRASDRLLLADMWRELASDPEAQLKRSLWAQSLSTALGAQFANSDDLFIDHTYLVLLAELIANGVVGVDLSNPQLDVARLVNGAEFAETRLIEGVVEADFFDWPLHSARADAFIRRLAKRVDQFDWSELQHDALKHLYESIIDAQTRKALGEYYTPDWLALQVVREVIQEPLGRRVLDPSCGSGTFIFHAVQHYLSAAEEAGHEVSQAVVDVTRQIFGFDLHPVAVALARVTYILAIGQERLATRTSAEPLQIPIFLADSLRWDVQDSLGTLDEGELVITVSEQALENVGTVVPGTLEFRFPEDLLDDPALFDRVVNAMHAFAHNKTRGKRTEDTLHKRFEEAGVIAGTREFEILSSTAANLRSLVEKKLDGIWSYYLRNQARPAWLAVQGAEGEGVDYLVGNPPWLGYKSMTQSMQPSFVAMMGSRGLASKGKGASGQDLSSLFVARSVEMYLRAGGHFGFVMPHSAIRQGNFEGFRSGDWSVHVGKGKRRVMQTRVQAELEIPWDVGTLASPPFPITSSVAFGKRVDGPAVAMPGEVRVLADRDGGGDVRTRSESRSATTASDYAARFRQGATLTPTFLTYVEVGSPEPGAPALLRKVKSERSGQEDERWKDTPSVTGVVERSFILDVHRGQTTVPFGLLSASHAVLPVVDGDRLDNDPPQGMRAWWREVNEIWDEGKKETYAEVSLLERLDYSRGIINQLPVGGTRVVYTRAGRTVSAVMTDDAIVDNTLYWARVGSLQEGDYVCAILNSDTLYRRTQEHSITGLLGTRDTHKNQFKSPIPIFDGSESLHLTLAGLGQKARELTASVDLSPGAYFVTARKYVRKALADSGVLTDIEKAVNQLLKSQGVGMTT